MGLDLLSRIGDTPLVPLRKIASGLPSALVAGVGTGGTLTGVARYLARAAPAALRVARAIPPGSGPVVVVLPDAADRYRSCDWWLAGATL